MTIGNLEHAFACGWWLCLVCVLLLVILWLTPWIRAVRLACSLPGPPAVPLLGNILILKNNKDIIQLANVAYQTFGTLMRGWLSFLPIIIVIEPTHLQILLQSFKLTEKNFFYALMHNFIGPGLITSNGDKWKSHRRYIQPYFHLSVLERLLHMFSESAHALVGTLKNEKEVNITTFVNDCVLNLLHEVILGIPIKEKELKALSPFRKGHVTLIDRILRPWLLLNFVYKFTPTAKCESSHKLTLQEFAIKVLEARKRQKDQNDPVSWCLLESLMEISENNSDFTVEDVVDEACTFMLAGQDSVGSAVSFTLYYLAKHEDIQEKVVEELKEVFAHSTEINMETLSGMKYLEQCIKETLRLLPSVPVIARKLNEDVRLGDRILPSGVNVFVSPYATHRLPQYYPDPEKFNPDRFSAKAQEERHPFAYIPFSAGPRNCIGNKFSLLEMKTIISLLLKNYRIAVAPGYQLDVVFRVTLRAKGGIWLRFYPR